MMSWSSVIYTQIGSADRLFQLCYPSSAASDPSIGSNVLGLRGLPWCTPDWTTLWVKKNCATFIFTVKADTHYPFGRAVRTDRSRLKMQNSKHLFANISRPYCRAYATVLRPSVCLW